MCIWVSHVKHTKCWQKASHSGVILNMERKEEERGVGREGKVDRMTEGGREVGDTRNGEGEVKVDGMIESDE